METRTENEKARDISGKLESGEYSFYTPTDKPSEMNKERDDEEIMKDFELIKRYTPEKCALFFSAFVKNVACCGYFSSHSKVRMTLSLLKKLRGFSKEYGFEDEAGLKKDLTAVLHSLVYLSPEKKKDSDYNIEPAACMKDYAAEIKERRKRYAGNNTDDDGPLFLDIAIDAILEELLRYIPVDAEQEYEIAFYPSEEGDYSRVVEMTPVSPLYMASAEARHFLIMLLLSYGADPRKVYISQKNPLMKTTSADALCRTRSGGWVRFAKDDDYASNVDLLKFKKMTRTLMDRTKESLETLYFPGCFVSLTAASAYISILDNINKKLFLGVNWSYSEEFKYADVLDEAFDKLFWEPDGVMDIISRNAAEHERAAMKRHSISYMKYLLLTQNSSFAFWTPKITADGRIFSESHMLRELIAASVAIASNSIRASSHYFDMTHSWTSRGYDLHSRDKYGRSPAFFLGGVFCGYDEEYHRKRIAFTTQLSSYKKIYVYESQTAGEVVDVDGNNPLLYYAKKFYEFSLRPPKKKYLQHSGQQFLWLYTNCSKTYNICRRNKDGNTALMYLLMNPDVYKCFTSFDLEMIINVSLEKGYDFSVKNNAGECLLDIIQANQSKLRTRKCIKKLEKMLIDLKNREREIGTDVYGTEVEISW